MPKFWRGIFRSQVWNALTVIVVKDTPEEIVVRLLPGTECRTESNYPKGKEHAKRRWDFKDKDWVWDKYDWHINRLLLIVEPENYFSTILFWNHASNEFVCYYMIFSCHFSDIHLMVPGLIGCPTQPGNRPRCPKIGIRYKYVLRAERSDECTSTAQPKRLIS